MTVDESTIRSRFEIVAHPEEMIGWFVARRQGTDPQWGPHTTLGLVRNGQLIAGVVYNHFSSMDVCMHVGAINGKRWLTKSFLLEAFHYPFVQLGKNRVTALVARKNKTTGRFVRDLGFNYEGKLRKHYPNDDLIVYGMLREECRWIRPGVMTHAEQKLAA